MRHQDTHLCILSDFSNLLPFWICVEVGLLVTFMLLEEVVVANLVLGSGDGPWLRGEGPLLFAVDVDLV